ncbi:MAG: dTDP-4-dehydrorhamnose 3,5-epimerase family protein [Candidatus Thorarchaeota archaeon]|jgi:dTDP-4-dehydrorhamnose 3,5-epimerase-like enzyme
MYKKLTTHRDRRGFFREVIRRDDEIFDGGIFGQLSHSMKHTGEYTPEFHYHRHQVDWWYVPIGMMRVVLCELRDYPKTEFSWDGDYPETVIERSSNYTELITTSELAIRIPPMTAHGFKVLEGPAHLIYVTSQAYNPEDEGRIKLDYDWLK